MSTDNVTLEVGGRRIERFLSYEINADLYIADDVFSLEVARPEVVIAPGQKCELYVNGELELTGIVDRCSRRFDKQGLTYRIEGRDLMGLLVDSYCEEFVTIQGKKLSELAQMLLKKVPFINREKIVYQEDVVGKLKGKKKTVDDPMVGYMDTPQKIGQIEPGMTVFEVLKNYAASRGLMFWAKPDGTFVFGRPKLKGEPVYELTNLKSGRGNNVLDGEENNDISRRYSKVVVIGQQQGSDDLSGPAAINTRAEAVDAEFPFYKPYVATDNNDAQSPALHARFIMEQQRHEGYQLIYTVQGHGHRGRNWQINELCRVRDEDLGVDKVFLIYGRTFRRSKTGGTITALKLGKPGVVI
ncbi:MAG: hypothetical protein LBD10_14810 [Desulfobulbus sp.]|jgi:prophage tail gpP-like protein|uniref:phage baseplate assembly protein n=1 Tax=Desulfobulbus sp. TaxID=895 RepID=UPI0028417DB2|nr:hypothetical protein [Desulfobulbus sp.]MDR2551459.1 hypothetical protein [Desulfobulbus sp.]